MSTRAGGDAHGLGRAGHLGALRALAAANVRFWPTVLPETHRELVRCEQGARMVSDPELRELALAKLADEPFNAEVAATLTTLAPRRERAQAIRAIVALEVLFDYLDGRTEQITEDPVAVGEALSAPMIEAVTIGVPHLGLADADVRPARQGHPTVDPQGAGLPPDWAYLSALSRRTRDCLSTLPAVAAVADTAVGAARRCVQAQTRLHAAATLGDGQLERWAREYAEGSGLQWREYAAGGASSVLAVHALIAAAADPATTRSDAERIDRAYLAIGAVITILDSVADRAADAAAGQQGFIRLFEAAELTGRLRGLTRQAMQLASEAPHGDHHVMTLAGVAAYYTTHPGARDPGARGAASAVRRELSPTIWPTLAVMRAWRAAKYARALRGRRGAAASVLSTDVASEGQGIE